MKRKTVGYYDYTVVLTYCGMLFAFFGILETIGHVYWNAIIALMMAGICDMFDGAVASTKKNRTKSEKRFGIQIDSLSDLISFGVLPAIFVYVLLDQNVLIGMISAVYVLCALIRLSYFNVLEEERQNETTETRKSYLGLPVTSIAVLLPAVFLLFENNVWKTKNCFMILMMITAVGFVAPVEIQKPKKLGRICLIVIGLMEAFAVVHFARGGIV